MKLSTFVKQVRKEFNKRYNDPYWTYTHIYLCNQCFTARNELILKCSNLKNIKAYAEFEELCKDFIRNRIEGQETVRQYLTHTRQLPPAINMYTKECNEYRKQILDDMLDWAIAQEDSQSLTSTEKK